MSTSSRYLNPPFDKRILNIGGSNTNIGAAKLKRGKLVCDQTNVKSMKGKAIRFLYNPVSVAVSHTIGDPSGIQNMEGGAQAKTQNGTFTNLGGVSVSLLYDRTYEVWDRSKKGTYAGEYGVYADVLAYYQLLGLVRTTDTTQYTKGPGPQNGTIVSVEKMSWDSVPSHPIDPSQRYYLYVGDKLRWYGILTDFEVTYTHFTQKMVPSRAEVSMSLQFQTEPHASKIHKSTVKKVRGR